MTTSARRARSSDRFEIDNVLDDLLASDDEDVSRKKTPLKKEEARLKSTPNLRKLSAKASDAEFYSNLKSLGGQEGEESEEEELSDGAVERLAAEIGDLDDLDNDLFSGLGSASGKKVQNKPASYDLNDPLAGLGLSDDDLDLSANKRKPAKKSLALLTRTLSYEKGRIEPHSGDGDESDEGKFSQSLENGDPFLTSLTSVSSRKIKKRNSDEILGINQNTSDSDVSPRQFTKQKKAKSRRKGSVEPSGASDADTDLDGSLNKPINSLLPLKSNEKSKRKTEISKKEEDLFGNSDGLPGMSDDDSPPKNVKAVQLGRDSGGTTNNALDSLLNPLSTNKKKQEPTMLEKIMTGKSPAKGEEKSGYSPSVASDRPTTAPNRRSVHFADQLGVDLALDGTTRPITAPESKQYTGRKKKTEIDLDSDFDETTKEWLALSKSKQESTDKKKAIKRQKTNDDWLGLGADLTDTYKLESSGELFTPKSEENVDKSLIEETHTSAKKGKTSDGKATLPWESPSRKPGTKPASRHRTPEKEKLGGGETEETSLHKIHKSDQLMEQPKQVIERKGVDETDGDEFLSLLKRGKEKRQAKKVESQDNVQSGNITNFEGKVHIDNNSISTKNVPPKDEHDMESKIHITGSSANLMNSLQDMKGNHKSEDHKEFLDIAQMQSTNVNVQETLMVQLLQKLVQRTTPHSAIPMSDLPLPALTNIQTMKEEVMRELDVQHQEEFNATKRQFERDKAYLESELKELQVKVLKMEESRTSSTTDYSKSVRELEANIRKLELEREQLLISLDGLRERHKSEMDALEASHKTRIGFIEDSYKRKELQFIEEAQMEKEHYEEKLKALTNEKEDVLYSCRKKEELMEKNKMAENNRLKSLHEKAVEELICEHNGQLEHMRVMKEQEVAAAVNAFSHTKSLQTLMQEVQDSTRQVSNLQVKIDATHKSRTDNHELTLKSRDEYLKNLQDRLTHQERGNEDERQHLQNLISKMEIQLREQTRQIEQDKWRLVQEENRLKTMQTAFEEEKRVMMEQIMQDRDQVSKAREEMLVDQRKIISECCEEKRKLENERVKISLLKKEAVNTISGGDNFSTRLLEADLEGPLSRYQQETCFSELKNEKENIIRERKELEKVVAETRAAGELIQQRSKEVEEFSIEAKRVHEEGIQAGQEVQCQKSELIDANKQLDVRLSFLQQFENAVKEEQMKLQVECSVFEREKEANKCFNCKSPMQLDQQNLYIGHPIITSLPQNLNSTYICQPTVQQQLINSTNQPHLLLRDATNEFANINVTPTLQTSQYRIQHTSTPDGNNNIMEPAFNSMQNSTRTFSSDSLVVNDPNLAASSESLPLPPPDLLMNSFEFKRSMRRYSHDKDKDDTFFEEETRFLKGLHEKRLR